MSKTVTSITTKLVEFDTTVPFAEVISRLDVGVNKATSQDILAKIKTAQNQDEFASVVKKAAGTDFLYFMETPHHKLLSLLDGVEKPAIVVYTFGNPLVAQGVLKYNPLSAYSIPLRILVIEKPDGTGTVVSYHLPSAALGVPVGENDPVLQAELEALDKRIENLAVKITAV